MEKQNELKSKQNYLKQEILDKHYNRLDFEKFIIHTKNIQEIDLNELTFDEIKELVKVFTKQQNREQNIQEHNTSQSELKRKEYEQEFTIIGREEVLGLNEQEEDQFQNDINDMNDISEQKDNFIPQTKLYDILVKDNKLKSKFKDIPIDDMYFNVSDPEYKLVAETYFIPKQCYYKVSSFKIQLIKSEVFRSFNDFVWFKDKLIQYYPGIFVPPIPNLSTQPHHSENTVLMLKNFLNAVSQIKIFCYGTLFEDFVSLPLNKFSEKKQKYNSIDTDLIKPNSNDTYEKIRQYCNKKYANSKKITDKLLKKSNALDELNKALDEFVNEFDVMKTKINNLTNALKKCKSTFSKDKIESHFITLGIKSQNWNNEINNTRNYINEHLLSLFQYINNEIHSFDCLIQKANFAKKDFSQVSQTAQNYNELRNTYEYYQLMVNEEYKNLILKQSNRIEKQMKLLDDKLHEKLLIY